MIACVCLTGGEVRCDQTWANSVVELLDHCIHCVRDRDSLVVGSVGRVCVLFVSQLPAAGSQVLPVILLLRMLYAV